MNWGSSPHQFIKAHAGAIPNTDTAWEPQQTHLIPTNVGSLMERVKVSI